MESTCSFITWLVIIITLCLKVIKLFLFKFFVLFSNTKLNDFCGNSQFFLCRRFHIRFNNTFGQISFLISLLDFFDDTINFLKENFEILFNLFGILWLMYFSNSLFFQLLEHIQLMLMTDNNLLFPLNLITLPFGSPPRNMWLINII